MAKVQFKAKVQKIWTMDETSYYEYIQVPTFKTSHCDMNAFRKHPKFGGYANSQLFPAILDREKTRIFGNSDRLRLDAIPEGVTVDTSKFLAVVTFEL